MVRSFHYTWTLPLVAVAAGLLGATFPLICHISVGADSEAGAGLSYLYLSNIIGSAAGSWIVGFILMDYWSLRGISVFVALLGVGTALRSWRGPGLDGRQKHLRGDSRRSRRAGRHVLFQTAVRQHLFATRI